VRWREILQWTFNVLVLAALAGVLAGVVYLFSVAIEQGATIVAAFLAAFATVAGAVLVRYFERRRHMEATRREHLGALYVQLGSALAGHDIPDRKRDKVVLDFIHKSLIYASPATLKTFRTWRKDLSDSNEPAAIRANALRYEVFIKAMRKDLGISNWMLQEGDLARTVLNDFDDLAAGEE
jgi:hypothetical protein